MPEQIDRAKAAEARVKPALERDLRKLGLRFGAPVFMRIFKRERELELWIEGDAQRFVLFRTYPICTYSGDLGPKQREGDNQAPEGFYRVSAGQLNPQSTYHLAFNLGYPNAYDRVHSRTGNFLMVHGSCVSIGCYAMGDDGIEEIYTLAAAALQGGQAAFDVHALPFRLDAAKLASEKDSPWHAFWSELKPAYDRFEQTRRPPRIEVRARHYAIMEP
ncbi:MAG: murein L,D-transpeptidase [Xanthomonadales bacterium]|nr:murein L,D-transpeptidase [Xanthomonadales bacterium]